MDRRRCYKHALGDDEVFKVFWVSARVDIESDNVEGTLGARKGAIR